MTEPQDVLADLLRRLDGWAGDAATRYERADEMVDVARRELRAALVRTPETLDVPEPTTERAAIAADRTWASGYSAGRAAAARAFAATPSPTPPEGLAELREALRDANAIVAMTRDHLAKDHPDCAYTGLGLLNDAARARLAAARGEPGLDVDALLAKLRDRFHEARAGTPEWRDGIRLGLEVAMNEVGYCATPTTPDPRDDA